MGDGHHRVARVAKRPRRWTRPEPWERCFSAKYVLPFEIASLVLLVAMIALSSSRGTTEMQIPQLPEMLQLTRVLQLSLEHFLLLSAVLFCIGLYGAWPSGMPLPSDVYRVDAECRQHQSVALRITSSPPPSAGQVFALFVITLAAAEAAVGLAIVLAIYRNT